MIAIIGNNLIYRIAEFYKNFRYFLRTVFTGLNAAVFIKFSAFLMRHLFEGGVYFEISFLNSLTTVTVSLL